MFCKFLHQPVAAFCVIIGFSWMSQSCQSGTAISSLDSLEGKPNEYWVYQNCKERTLEPAEVVTSSSPKRLRRVVTIDPKGMLTLEFHDEIGQQYSLVVPQPTIKTAERTLWKGEAKLAHAVVGIDIDPLIIAYELVRGADGSESEIIYTKGVIPEVFLEENIEKAYEVNRYSDGQAVMAVLMQKENSGKHAYYIERACGKAFGYDAQVDQREVSREDFLTEISL